MSTRPVLEPAAVRRPSLSFFVERHYTTRPHYDLHVELEGRLIGWMLPRAPSPAPGVRRFALRTPDRDPAYGHFEGVIPKGEPGAGVVMLWDYGSFEPFPPSGMAFPQWMSRGLLRLHFTGEKLRGVWEMVRWRTEPGTPETWVLLKLHDRHAGPADALEAEEWSAMTGRSREEIETAARRIGSPRSPSGILAA